MKRYFLMIDVSVVDTEGKEAPFAGTLEMSAVLDTVVLFPCNLSHERVPGLWAKVESMAVAYDATEDLPTEIFVPKDSPLH